MGIPPYNTVIAYMGETSARVNGIVKSILYRLHSSEPLGLSQIFCDLLKHFNTDHLSTSEQISLSTRLLDQGILDIVIDLLSSLTFDLATYVNLVTLSVTLLTTPNDPPDCIRVGEDKLARIVEYLLTAAHNALGVLLSNLRERRHDLYPVISTCLSLLLELAANFSVVRVLAISSYSFLHLVVQDDGTVTSPILSCLFSLLEMSKDELNTIKPKILFNILDELILKLPQSDQTIVCKSFDSIAIILCNSPQLQPDRLSRRYKGVTSILKKLFGSGFDDLLKEVILMLDPSFKFEVREERAAQLIQSVWRGFLVRERLSDFREATIILQRRFRAKKWSVDFNRRCEKAKLLKLQRKQDEMRDESIRTQTDFFKKLEKLPARKVPAFLAKRQSTAALTIQQWWRRLVGRKVSRQLREERMIAATRIQLWFRKFLAEQALAQIHDSASDGIEEEIRLFRETRRKLKLYNDEDLDKIESKVTEIVNDDSLGLSGRKKLLHICDDLLRIIESKCILMNFPNC